jgi:hypothetical protein
MNKQVESNGQRLEGMKEDCWKPGSTMDCSASEEGGGEKGTNLK